MNKERGEERIHKQATRINWERTNPQERKQNKKDVELGGWVEPSTSCTEYCSFVLGWGIFITLFCAFSLFSFLRFHSAHHFPLLNNPLVFSYSRTDLPSILVNVLLSLSTLFIQFCLCGFHNVKNLFFFYILLHFLTFMLLGFVSITFHCYPEAGNMRLIKRVLFVATFPCFAFVICFYL